MLVVHVAAACGLYAYWDPTWLLLTALCSFVYLNFAQEMYCHRYLCHRAFDMPVWLQRVCAVLSLFNLYGHPIGIAATHATHHKHSDTDRDPHPASSPWRSWFWMGEKFDKSIDTPTARRLMRDEFLVFLQKHYFLIYCSVVIGVCMIHAKAAVYGLLVPHVYAFAANGLVTVFCHSRGYRNHDTNDKSTNNLGVNALLMFSGIALHNNHHAHPGRYSCSEKWYEVDLVGCIISGIKKE